MQVNAAELKVFEEELTARGIEFADSQTNFVYLRTEDGAAFKESLLKQGVIVRTAGNDWVRVTVGTEAENQRFFASL